MLRSYESARLDADKAASRRLPELVQNRGSRAEQLIFPSTATFSHDMLSFTQSFVYSRRVSPVVGGSCVSDPEGWFPAVGMLYGELL